MVSPTGPDTGIVRRESGSATTECSDRVRAMPTDWSMELTIRSTIRLNNGVEIPRLGLGVYRLAPGEQTRNAIAWALEAGYRQVDTAAFYRNEEDVGRAIRESGIPREEVFVTTKLWNDDHGYDRALAALDASLERLGFDYVDLYLIHWPVPELRLESWRALERAYREGKARAIGVSNYMMRHLEELLSECEVVPAVNQIELTPWSWRSRQDVVELCRARGIALEAYSPLAKGRKLDDPVLVEVAAHLGRSPAQVLIRWALQHDLIVIPKSAHRDRIRENANVFDFEIPVELMARLESLDHGLVTGWDPTEAP